MLEAEATPPSDEPPPLFELDGGRYLPTAMSTSPWGDGLVGGAMLSGLLAQVIETEIARLPAPEGAAPLLPARLTVDLVRPVPRAPLTIATTLLRAGRRLVAMDAAIHTDEGLVARARSLWLRQSAEPPGKVAHPAEGTFAGPAAFERDPLRAERPRRDPWERRTVQPRGGTRPAAVWIRLASPLIAGLATSRFVQAAAAADFANPQGNEGEAGLQFVNADISLTLHRLPLGVWMLAEAVARSSEAGIAFATCALADEQGRFGASSVASLASARGQ